MKKGRTMKRVLMMKHRDTMGFPCSKCGGVMENNGMEEERGVRT